MWNPFKKSAPPAPVVESFQEPPNLKGLELLKKFTTATEPKVADYPKGKYVAYWEILVQDVPGGYSAMVRFYKYDTGLDAEQQFVAPNVASLKVAVNEHILKIMPQYLR